MRKFIIGVPPILYRSIAAVQRDGGRADLSGTSQCTQKKRGGGGFETCIYYVVQSQKRNKTGGLSLSLSFFCAIVRQKVSRRLGKGSGGKTGVAGCGWGKEVRGAGAGGSSLDSWGMYRGVPFVSRHLRIKCPPLSFRQSAEGKAETWCEGSKKRKEKRTQHTSDISNNSNVSAAPAPRCFAGLGSNAGLSLFLPLCLCMLPAALLVAIGE